MRLVAYGGGFGGQGVDFGGYFSRLEALTFRRYLRNVKRFRGGLVFEAHRLLYHSTL